MVNELVGVTKVQPIQSPNTVPKAPDSAGTSPADSSSAEVTEEDALASETAANDFPAITFYPDGSCDSAEIVLASRNEEDERLLAVRLSGILGSVSSHSVSKDGESTSEEVESQPESDSLDSSGTSSPAQDPLAETE